MTSEHSGAGFDDDLKRGQARESAFTDAVTEARVEHKWDKKARDTGNVFVEYEQPTGASGIARLEAQFWAIQYDDDCWLVLRTSLLRALATRAWDEHRRKNGGDFNRYKGVLIPVSWLLSPWKTLREHQQRKAA